MIEDPCLYSDSNLLPVLQFLPSMSRHKETDGLGWLPKRQERQPSLGAQAQPRSALYSTGIPPTVTGTNVVKWYCALSLEEECEVIGSVNFLESNRELECNC